MIEGTLESKANHFTHWSKSRLGINDAICGIGRSWEKGSGAVIYVLFPDQVTCPQCHEILEHA